MTDYLRRERLLRRPAVSRIDRAPDGLLGQCFELDGRVMEVIAVGPAEVRVRLDGGRCQNIERAVWSDALRFGSMAVATRRPSR